MTDFDYRAAIEPAIDAIVDGFERMEVKHGEGIYFSTNDPVKTVSHMIQFMEGRANEDGISHATASGIRAIKTILAEVE